MEYEFEGYLVKEGGKNIVKIPFNVWEICNDNVGDVPVKVCIEDVCFQCKLAPIKNGYYDIPLTDEQAALFSEGKGKQMLFSVIGKEKEEREDSPYSKENPIRKIDSMEILIQPWDGLCGQTVFAMLAGVSIDEASNIMHCREWQASMLKIIQTLDYVGIRHANKIIYTGGKDVDLPECCIIMENLGRFSHYLIGYKGSYYDPNKGIMKEFDKSNIKGYLEIITD